jgi:hypothetical protein
MGNQETLYRQISDQLLGKRHISFMATDHEIGHGRDIAWNLRAKEAPEHIKANWHGTSWIVEVIAKGTRDGYTPFHHKAAGHPRSIAASGKRALEH